MSFCGKVINEILYNLTKKDERIYHLGEDILDPYGGAFKITKGISNSFPKQVLGMPISEASIIGFSTGLALQNKIPIAEIMFGDFMTLTFDQILNHLSKFPQMYNQNIPSHVVIRTPMGGYRGYGPTHSQSLEKYFVGIPGVQIIAISDIHNLEALYNNAVLNEKRPIIIIENKSVYSYIYKHSSSGEVEGFKLEFSKEEYPSVILSKDNEDPKLTIICYGGLSTIIRDIVKARKDNIKIIVLSNLSSPNFHLIKNHLINSKNILIVEEGTIGFGISSEYAFNVKEFFNGKIFRIGAKQFIIPNAKHLEEEILPSKNLINEKISEILRENE